MTTDVLVAGIGNVFFGDDGFGVEVAARLAREPLPAGVEVADFGIRGLHLAYRLLDAPRLLVLVDAVRRGGPPGTLYVIDPQVEEVGVALADAHAIDVGSVLAAVRALGGALPPTRVVGCEAGSLTQGMGLSAAVAGAVPEALRLVRELALQYVAAAPGVAAAEEARS